MTENEISFKIRGCIYTVYKALGPGLYESVYEKALITELSKQGLNVRSQVPITAVYEGVDLGEAFRLDLLIEDKVIVEIKSIETLLPVHHKQLITYLRLTELKLGILVNFNTADINQGIIRKVNNL
ncbi:MAG: GxxExxY protein [Synergistaceae bacterium]|jgi:GxxExxY protein